MLILLTYLACDGACHTTTKMIPALEKVDPSWGAEPVDCDESHSPPYATKGCIHKKIECGDIIEGTTRGGDKNFGDDFYQKGHFTPQRNDYEDSPEAVYQLRVPANQEAFIRLDSNCVDLDVAALPWQQSECPTVSHIETNTRETEMKTGPEGGTLRLSTVDKAETYFVIVDGKQGVSGNFRLDIRCRNYR